MQPGLHGTYIKRTIAIDRIVTLSPSLCFQYISGLRILDRYSLYLPLPASSSMNCRERYSWQGATTFRFRSLRSHFSVLFTVSGLDPELLRRGTPRRRRVSRGDPPEHQLQSIRLPVARSLFSSSSRSTSYVWGPIVIRVQF